MTDHPPEEATAIELGPADLYVHVADDGGIYVMGARGSRPAWVTLADLQARVGAVVAGDGQIALSTERGSEIGAPAAQVVVDAGVSWTQVEPRPETRRAGGVTALISAAGVGAVGLVDDLIARGADLEQQEDLGRTALMVAASEGQEETLRHLAAAGAHLDARDARGRTALALAAIFGHAGTVTALLDLGADPSIRDRRLRSPRSAARARGHPEVARLLGGSAAGPLRPRLVLTDRPGELVIRVFDPYPVRISGLAVAVACVLIGAVAAATGSAHEVVNGLVAGAVLLVLFYLLSLLAGRQAVRVAQGTLQRRDVAGWGTPVHLDRVVAVHYIPRIRGRAALQLLGDERGSLHGTGVYRWQGPQPPPTGPGGEQLRCLLVPLGPAGERILAAAAPSFLGRAAMDEATRETLAAAAGTLP